MNRGLHKISSPQGKEKKEKPYNIVELEDEFVSGLGTSGSIGSLGWLLGAGTVTNGTISGAGALGHFGIINLSSGTTANVRGRIFLSPVTINHNGLQANCYEELHFLFRPNTTFSTSGSLRAGLIDYNNINTTGETAGGIYLSTLAGDTNWFLACSGLSRIDTGIPRSVDRWLLLSIKKIGNTHSFNIFVNERLILGNFRNLLSDNGFGPAFIAETNNTVAKSMLIDYFYQRLNFNNKNASNIVNKDRFTELI
jgi:hypothetical protein